MSAPSSCATALTLGLMVQRVALQHGLHVVPPIPCIRALMRPQHQPQAVGLEEPLQGAQAGRAQAWPMDGPAEQGASHAAETQHSHRRARAGAGKGHSALHQHGSKGRGWQGTQWLFTSVMSGPKTVPTPRVSFIRRPGSMTGSDHRTSVASRD